MKLFCTSIASIIFGVSFAIVFAQGRKEPMIIGENIGVDGSYCESAKADFDLIAEVASERKSNVTIIARLGTGERAGLKRITNEATSY
jgi:hypothetical protein